MQNRSAELYVKSVLNSALLFLNPYMSKLINLYYTNLAYKPSLPHHSTLDASDLK